MFTTVRTNGHNDFLSEWASALARKKHVFRLQRKSRGKTKMRTGLETKSENESAKKGEEDEVGTLLGRSVGRLLYGFS